MKLRFGVIPFFVTVVLSLLLTAGCNDMQRIRHPGREKDVAVHPAEELLRQGHRLAERNRYEAARHQYEAIAKLDLPYAKPLSLANMADSYRRQGDYGKAREAYRGMLEIEGLSFHYRFYALFNIAETYTEENRHLQAREIYAKILAEANLSQHYRMRALFGTGDSYITERSYTQARRVYGLIRAEAEAPPAPHEHYRTEAIDRLALMENLADGQPLPDPRRERVEWTEKPETAFYISPNGDDNNPGSRRRPFATPERARDAIRALRADSGLPEGGVTVYFRSGRYFRTEPFELTAEDSGTPDSPIVYRAYPGEEVRLIGGVEITGFVPVTDEKIIARLPEASRGRVMQADLKAQGIYDYGTLKSIGFGARYSARAPRTSPLELSYNRKMMTLARWPSEGWARIDDVPEPAKVFHYRRVNEEGRFNYAGERPERWAGEQEIWMQGYWSVTYGLQHRKVGDIDLENRIITLESPRPSTRAPVVSFGISGNSPYFAYNLLSELDVPGEYYIDRETGILYFYPPGPLTSREEILASMMEEPLVVMDDASHIVFRGITLEMTRADALTIKQGRDNMIAGCTIRNIGQSGVAMGNRHGEYFGTGEGGSRHRVIGCDIYDTGKGGVIMEGGDIKTLTPSDHLVENCRIYRFNRRCGGYEPAISMNGIGSRASYNLLYDSPHQAVWMRGNDHIFEYNELFDVVHEARDMGAIYSHDRLTSRGNVIRYNLFHHITEHSSPNTTQNMYGIMLDNITVGRTIYGNIFYRMYAGSGGGVRDVFVENNIFAELHGRAIGLGDGGWVAEERWERFKREQVEEDVPYRRPPWSSRYPQLIGLMEDDPSTGHTMKRNLIFRPSTTLAPEDALTVDNYMFAKGQEPLWMDAPGLDFRVWPGAPLYGETGFQPLPLEDIGLYADDLRASWPVEKQYGRYFKKDLVPQAKEYTAGRRTRVIDIDGLLRPEEWGGLDKEQAMVLERFYTDWTGQYDHLQTEHRSYAWAFYDDQYLYIGVLNIDRPVIGDERDNPVVEVAIEGQEGPFAHWWIADQTTGPIYVLQAFPEKRPDISVHESQKLRVLERWHVPSDVAANLNRHTLYAAKYLDGERTRWSAEFRIPFEHMGINPREAKSLRFNIGVEKRDGWFAWNPTGAHINFLERGGVIHFER